MNETIQQPRTLQQWRRETASQPSLSEVVAGLRTWQAQHQPYDRTTPLNMFQYVIEEGTGGALVPLGNGLAEGSHLPAIRLSNHAQSQYLQRLRYPKDFFDRLAQMPAGSKLNALNLNWLVQNTDYQRAALFRMQDNDTARALMTEAYSPVDNLELLEMVEPYLAGAVVRWHADDLLTFHMSVSFPNYAEELKAGDILERGLHISNSEVGLRSVTIAGYMFRLVCTNGLIGTGGNGDSFRFRHVGNGDNLKDKIKTAVESTKLETEKIVSQFKNALTVQVERPFDLIERVSKDRQLSREEFKLVMDSYLNAPDEDKGHLFGVSQAFSNAANAPELASERSYELQRVAVDVSGRTRGD